MATADALINAMTTMLVTLDPPGLAPVFLGLTMGMTAGQRRQVALRGSIIAFAILAVFSLFGASVLGLLGISMGAFRIAGGLLLFWISFEMVFEKRTERKEKTSQVAITIDHVHDIAVFPLALPLIAGPGAISATVLLAGTFTTVLDRLLLIGVLALMMAVLYFTLLLAERLDRFLGITGRAILTRLLGVLLAALSVQFVVDGIRSAFSDPPAIERVGFTRADLDEVLKEYDEFIDIDRDDLETILRRTEMRSYRRRAGDLLCAAIMSRDVIAVSPDTSLKEAHALMRSHHIKALPVTNDNAEVIGIVTQTDLLDKLSWRSPNPGIGFQQRVRLALSGKSAPNDTAKDIMTSPVKTVFPETALADAIIIFAEQGLHHLPVIQPNNKLAGILSQSDVLAAMLADQASRMAMSELKTISIRGAREHNLKGIDLDLPRNSLIVMTGLSGSGKSSLAFDTIYAEGQRRYVESLSAYARQFLEMMQKPDVDQIDGLSPAISIEQKTTSRNPRSTVGTVTEIYDYMRLLFARVGVPYSPATGLPIESQTVSQMVDRILAFEDGTRLYILAPMIRGRKGEYKKELAELMKKGFQRVKVDGQFYEIADVPALDKKYKHDIDVVVDRLVVRADIGARLADSLETSLKLADGLAVAEFADKPLPESETAAGGSANKSLNETHERVLFSEKFACPVSGFTIPEIEPRLFSFNNPFGACPTCDGLGSQQKVDQNLIVPEPARTLRDGAIAPWAKSTSPYYNQTLEGLGKVFGFKLSSRWNELSEDAQTAILQGTEEKIEFHYADGARSYKTTKTFEGIVPNLERRWKETDSAWAREEIERYMSAAPCPACKGYRLKPEALAVKINKLHIGETTEMSIKTARDWFETLPETLNAKQNEIAVRILKEIRERLRFLNDVGLDYLSLSRNSGTLSGGESQRIRLASQIGSGLTGVLYVLDEPSIGLHQRDNARLLDTLKHLRDIGNTVIVVEHDEDAILTADYVVDIGPAAGIHGGQVVAEGTPQQIMANPKSLTGKYLSGELGVAVPAERRKPKKGKELKVVGARGNNLKNVTASVPLGVFTAVTGVSGGGKSTFLIETLYKSAARRVMGAREIPADHDRIDGFEHIDKVIDIDQSPIGRTPRSNPATYTGAFTPIRDWFAGLPEAKTRGYAPGRFSFNVKGGRCEACQGDGVIKIEMHFLPDVYVTCDLCHGKRYNRETLDVHFKGKSIADVLDMTVEEGVEFFSAVPAVRDKLQALFDVGLGYIKVGQQANTLSGGEAQRVKLAKELSKRSTGRTLYILDEPTTGLHFHDVAKLLEMLQELVNQGNSVVVIEHNLEVIKTADWIIDIGPEGGTGGGEIVAQGTPEQVVKEKRSHTGRFLKELLERRPPKKVNGTYYSSQKPETFAKWASEVPEGFVFSLKASRYATNRKVLSEAGESIERFLGQGLVELGNHLGPILWQFAPTKKFEPDDFEGFLKLLPRALEGLPLRHVVEVRHDSFKMPEFVQLLRKYEVAPVCADHFDYPMIADVTADFVYARLQKGSDDIPTCYTEEDLELWAKRLETWAEGDVPSDLSLVDPDEGPKKRPRDVFAFFIHEGKVNAPQGAMAMSALLERRS
eukprot:g19953.t1